jgi:hypothetical protein
VTNLEFLANLFGVSGMVDSLSFLFFVRLDLPDSFLCALVQRRALHPPKQQSASFVENAQQLL